MRGIKTWMGSSTTEQDREERFSLKLVLDKLFQNQLKMDEWDQDMDGLKTTEQESVVDIDSLELCSLASTWH